MHEDEKPLSSVPLVPPSPPSHFQPCVAPSRRSPFTPGSASQGRHVVLYRRSQTAGDDGTVKIRRAGAVVARDAGGQGFTKLLVLAGGEGICAAGAHCLGGAKNLLPRWLYCAPKEILGESPSRGSGVVLREAPLLIQSVAATALRPGKPLRRHVGVEEATEGWYFIGSRIVYVYVLEINKCCNKLFTLRVYMYDGISPI